MPRKPADAAQPNFQVDYREIQRFGTLKQLPIAREDNVRAQSVATLNQVLEKQVELADMIAKRNATRCGIGIAMARDVAEVTTIPRPPKGREHVPTRLGRLLEAQEIILRQAHENAEAADDAVDDGANDLLVSDIIRTNEPQVWFIAEHLAETALVRSDKR